MACPKDTSDHTKVVHFKHDEIFAPGEDCHPDASGSSAFNTTKIFEQWSNAVDLYFKLNLKGATKKHRHLLRELRLLVPPEQPETSLTPKIQKLIAFVWFNIGQIKTLEGQDSVACEAYNLSVKLDGTFALAWYGLGSALFKLDSFKKSEKAFATCLKLFDAMETKSTDIDLRVTLGNGAKADPDMEGGGATVNTSEESLATTETLEKKSPIGRIKKYVLDHSSIELNMQLAELHKAWKAAKVPFSPGGKGKLNALPSNVVYSPVKYKTIMNSSPYDAFFNPPKNEEGDEEEIDMSVRGYHDALTEIASSSKMASPVKEQENLLSLEGKEIASSVKAKEVPSSSKGKKNKSSSKGKGNSKGKGKAVDVKGNEKTVDAKRDGKQVHVHEKDKMVEAQMKEKDVDPKGKGDMVDQNWKETMLRTKKHVGRCVEHKPRKAKEIELYNFANAYTKEQKVPPLWLQKHRAIEEHFEDYHTLLPARDIVLDDFYRHAQNAVINTIYENTSKFDLNIPPLEESLKGVDAYYRKAFKEIPDLEGEEDWYRSIYDMFYGTEQHLEKVDEVEQLCVGGPSVPGNISTDEYKTEMKNFLGIDTPSFAEKPLPELPIAAKLALLNQERKVLLLAIKDLIKAKADAREPRIDYRVNVKVDRSSVVWAFDPPGWVTATATPALSESTAASTHFGSVFTGARTGLLSPVTPLTGNIDGIPAILVTPPSNVPFPRFSEPEFEIGLPGMRTSLHGREYNDEATGDAGLGFMPDGVTPLQRGTGDGVIIEGAGEGEMLYPTVFEGF